MDSQQDLLNDIDKQIGMGFSYDEIKSNLLAKGYSETVIQAGLDNRRVEQSKEEKKKPGIGQIVVSVLIIIIGIYDVTSNKSGFRHSWGYVLIAIGVIGLILKLAASNSNPKS